MTIPTRDDALEALDKISSDYDLAGGWSPDPMPLLATLRSYIESHTGECWKDMDSAPKDGSTILVTWQAVQAVGGPPTRSDAVAWWDDCFEQAEYNEETGEYAFRGAWTDGGVASWAYEENRELHPTNWMPLPTPPLSIGDK